MVVGLHFILCSIAFIKLTTFIIVVPASVMLFASLESLLSGAKLQYIKIC